jgi:hypothetical protein
MAPEDPLDDIENEIDAALPTAKLVAEFHTRLDEVAESDWEARVGVLLRMAWQSGPTSATIAQEILDIYRRGDPQNTTDL